MVETDCKWNQKKINKGLKQTVEVSKDENDDDKRLKHAEENYADR